MPPARKTYRRLSWHEQLREDAIAFAVEEYLDDFDLTADDLERELNWVLWGVYEEEQNFSAQAYPV